MTKLTLYAAIMTFATVAMYLIVAFVEFDLNPAQWSEGARSTMALVWVLITAIAVVW